MNKNKITQAEFYTGIDTVEVRSDSEIILEADTDLLPSTIRKNTQTGACYYKINPDKCSGLRIYNSDDYYMTMNYIIDNFDMTNPTKTRIDFRIDSLENNFNELMKLNKLLILLIALAYSIDNRYYSVDPLTLDKLCIRVQNQYIEAENYNKAIEEPDDIVKNRLELRSKKLYDNTDENSKEQREFKKWCNRLDKAVSKENFEHLQIELNRALYEKYQEESGNRGFTINEFLYKYQSSIFTSRQLSEFYKKIGYKDPLQQAKKYKQRKGIEYFSHKNLITYVQMIKESGCIFFNEST